jgi:hypothetical protein
MLLFYQLHNAVSNNKEGQMLPAKTSKFTFLFGPIAKMFLAVILGCLMAWTIISVSERWSPEAREKAFQSQLTECDRLAELNGNDWRLKLVPDDTCALIFEEYGKRIDEEDKRQAIDKAAKANINDGMATEPPDTE